MTLQRWRKSRLQRQMEDMDRMFDWPSRLWWRRVFGDGEGFEPSMDLVEKGDKFIVRTELPGMDKDDIDISMTGDMLTIKGERKMVEDTKEEEYQAREICYGAFSRTITLPAPVEAENIHATYESGILEIELPKAKEAKSQRIEIKAK